MKKQNLEIPYPVSAAIEALLLDDMPDSSGIHLYPEQRLPMLETVWRWLVENNILNK